MRREQWKSGRSTVSLQRGHRPYKDSVSRKVNAALSAILLVILLPVFFTVLYQKLQLEDIVGQEGQKEPNETESALVGVVAREISVSHSDECIKAQCVIARTNLLSAKQSQTAEPEALTMAQMQELWGDQFQAVYQRLQALISETAGETLTYNGQYIYAAYHSISAGNTRNMAELYPDSGMPYLATTACHEDTVAPDYLSVNYWEGEEFLKCCKQLFPENNIENLGDIQVIERDSAGYVLKVQVGQTIYEGEKFRNLMGWNSSNFSLTEFEGNMRVVTLGLGHGFGLSQYTAEIMAKGGKKYKEILQYFYPGAQITE